ncbi:uncharacterized protein HMPREF1541_00213 [Cyphellophora europaea CBS 101466]|uniref:Large ribosomal subunit protein uL29m n=1 Tax=Cyphellophora europaea (strain CBS 101466) TaxID=1220924 RepID=W2SBP4_CYPE1|nr:uncharacterized protein HMPREF1541_00213 [Cyphellophora europaea CBS 101466]ETN46030.1 hypothetical protein HMPREF1541_00213 [Cyphellophora europaea CBS 101466]
MVVVAAVPARLRPFSVPIFLAPAFATASSFHSSAPREFSTSPTSASRRTTGPNKKRGVSAIRSIPPKQKTEVYKYDLPIPIISPERRALFKTSDKHGLWGFFNERKQPMVPAAAEAQHGRAWSYMELTIKSFEDLHKLYWKCILEANQINTRARELRRTRAGYGATENEQRLKVVCNPLTSL